jgi:hypothetical protein
MYYLIPHHTSNDNTEQEGGGGAHLLVALSEPADEQGLREAVRHR